MKKSFLALMVAVAAVFVSCGPAQEKQVKVEGDWKFSEFVEGTSELNPQNKAMIESIVKVYQECEVSFGADGKVTMKSPTFGEKSGDFSIKDGKLDQNFGPGAHITVNVINEGENLVVIFNEEDASMGKIVLTKK